MEELVYFGKFDLLIKVFYDRDVNTIRYVSHRKIAENERKFVENYLIMNYGSEVGYFEEDYGALMFVGVDANLDAQLQSFRLEHDLKKINARSYELDAKVRQLVKGSLKEFYFERIGDSLLEFREQLQKGDQEEQVALERLKYNILKLIEAYNNYSEQKVTLDTAVPSDLRVYFN